MLITLIRRQNSFLTMIILRRAGRIKWNGILSKLVIYQMSGEAGPFGNY